MLKRLLKVILVLVLLVIVGVIAFVVTLQVTEYVPAETEILTVATPDGYVGTEVTIGATIKIMTWNIGYGSLSATEDFVMDGGVKGRMDSEAEVTANLDAIAGVLTTQTADIYFLQEVDEASNRSYDTLQYTRFTDLFAMPVSYGLNYRCRFVPFPFEIGQMMGNVTSGIVTAADFTVESATRHQLPGAFAWPIRLANLKRCIVVTRLPVAGSDHKLVLINVHLSAYDDGTMRLQEMAALKTIMGAETDAGNYVIVGGDFNQTFPNAVTYTDDGEGNLVPSYLYELKDPTYWQAYGMDGTWFAANGWHYGVDTSHPTCRLLNHPLDTLEPANNQYYLIDGFLVSGNIAIELVTTLDLAFANSDHNPVVMSFHLM